MGGRWAFVTARVRQRQSVVAICPRRSGCWDADVNGVTAADAPGSSSNNAGSRAPSDLAAAARSTRVARFWRVSEHVASAASLGPMILWPAQARLLAALGPVHRLREVARLDRSRLAVAAAVPGAIGYAVPGLVGLATAHVADSVAASAGALIVGFANLGGRYRVRSATLLAATAAAGVAALSGGLAGPSVVATVVLMGVRGFASGLLVSFGLRAAFVADEPAARAWPRG
jgi:hypothetical protein